MRGITVSIRKRRVILKSRHRSALEGARTRIGGKLRETREGWELAIPKSDAGITRLFAELGLVKNDSKGLREKQRRERKPVDLYGPLWRRGRKGKPWQHERYISWQEAQIAKSDRYPKWSYRKGKSDRVDVRAPDEFDSFYEPTRNLNEGGSGKESDRYFTKAQREKFAGEALGEDSLSRWLNYKAREAGGDLAIYLDTEGPDGWVYLSGTPWDRRIPTFIPSRYYGGRMFYWEPDKLLSAKDDVLRAEERKVMKALLRQFAVEKLREELPRDGGERYERDEEIFKRLGLDFRLRRGYVLEVRTRKRRAREAA